MKKQNAILIFFFCATLFFVSFIYGYKMMSPNNNKEPLIISDDPLDLEIIKEDERISPNVYIEKKTYYKTCNHNITKLNELDNQIVNMTENQYRDYMEENFPNVKIISFSINRIVLREERNHICPNHYIIGESEGKIAIYGIDEDGEKVLDRVFKDYPISLLKKIDQEKLIEGIRVDSEEELSDVLENFIS
ncbi:BofC C-terminal domain-containing protein [Clostridium sp. Cult2]|uniref:BofC C-terminal domain-containing protein n=1 Tax=Clostridium sp. Cult2 TaxID=2079003 RepID=UPI001F460738|nr:BofC C-terminal domain-containing protein [Clostridium sp. Cult2]MCF6465906.1 hypothetical protein [Clostridium sp. Cult2]